MKLFFHNFLYSFKILLRNKVLVFWIMLFPIILGTFFYLAFSQIEKKESFEAFPIGVVVKDNSIMANYAKNVFQELSKDGQDKIFQMEYMSVLKAEEKLQKKEIVGYVICSSSLSFVIGNNGIYETILKTVVDQVLEEFAIYTTLLEKNEENKKMDKAWIEKTGKEINTILQKSFVSLIDDSPSKLSYTMIEFYSLIAMTCFYGAMLAMTSVNKNLANMSFVGKRVQVSPTPKFHLIFSSLLASFLIQIISLMVLFFYTTFLLHIHYGEHFLWIVLLSLFGAIAGLSLGVFVASVLKSNENIKIGFLILITMFGCFLSGMMGITMKYLIDTNFPIINRLNPLNMITDGFYSLYYYGVHGKFFLNLFSLGCFSIVLIGISVWVLRRQAYDSI